MRICFIVLLLGLLTACKNTPTQITTPLENPLNLVNSNLFSPVTHLNESDIFHLTENQTQEFLNFYHLQKNKEFPSSNERIILNFLDEKLTGFTFHGDTLNAQDAFAQQRGNCISLAVFTTALADLINSPIDYQLVINEPVYFKKGSLILSSSHLRSRVYNTDKSAPKDTLFYIPKSVIIDYFPTRGQVRAKKVKRPQLIAKYYANLAAEALIKNNLDLSFSYLFNAMQHDPYNSELINLQAVLHRRAGDTETASALYQYAVENDLANINLYQNYLQLAQSQNNQTLVQTLNTQLAHINDPNPYSWLELGQQAINNQDISYAKFYFGKAIKAAHYIPEPYVELAKIAYQNADFTKANQLLATAIERTYDDEKLAIYQAKYQALQTVAGEKH